MHHEQQPWWWPILEISSVDLPNYFLRFCSKHTLQPTCPALILVKTVLPGSSDTVLTERCELRQCTQPLNQKMGGFCDSHAFGSTKEGLRIFSIPELYSLFSRPTLLPPVLYPSQAIVNTTRLSEPTPMMMLASTHSPIRKKTKDAEPSLLSVSKTSRPIAIAEVQPTQYEQTSLSSQMASPHTPISSTSHGSCTPSISYTPALGSSESKTLPPKATLKPVVKPPLPILHTSSAESKAHLRTPPKPHFHENVLTPEKPQSPPRPEAIVPETRIIYYSGFQYLKGIWKIWCLLSNEWLTKFWLMDNPGGALHEIAGIQSESEALTYIFQNARGYPEETYWQESSEKPEFTSFCEFRDFTYASFPTTICVLPRPVTTRTHPESEIYVRNLVFKFEEKEQRLQGRTQHVISVCSIFQPVSKKRLYSIITGKPVSSKNGDVRWEAVRWEGFLDKYLKIKKEYQGEKTIGQLYVAKKEKHTLDYIHPDFYPIFFP